MTEKDTSRIKEKNIGVLCVLAASFIWAIEVILVKLAYNSGSALDTLMIRNLIIAIMAVIYLAIINKSFINKPFINKSFINKPSSLNFSFNHLNNTLRISKTELYHIILISIILTIADGFFYFGLGKVTAVNGVLVSHMQPIFIVFFGYFLFFLKIK